MDSLTQITLGAAVGEVVLGKKVGNRAMIWGAIAGTLPDLDVLANLVTDPVSALAYHRAFTHSLAYAVVIPLGLGMLVHRLYGGRDGPLPAARGPALVVTWLFLLAVIAGGNYLMPLPIHNLWSIALVVSGVTILFPLVVHVRELWRRVLTTYENPGWLGWSHLFFWAILTHPLLDACTAYGTQLFEPLSSQRVAWNVVAVVDPLYTVPFLACVVLASRQVLGSRARSRYNWAGIFLSSAYLLFCTFLHFQVVQRLADTLVQEKITANRSLVGPTIFNSILWQGTAETDSSYYTGQYSFFDKSPFFKLQAVPKRHDLLQGHWNDRDVAILRWFTDGYFSVDAVGDSLLRMNDLRYGQVGGSGPEQRPAYVFFFVLKETDGELRAQRIQQGPEDRQAIFGALWTRILGEGG
ncbi:MAG: hypothetical protein DA408_02560 [Bacteroidetes bacterium]|nr:MAG: hypothetical protein C7N36_21855 [Bacteroidota bacterium]PTM14691.1 MAG: hypothetical protein DA408_02560 [Bacteroidota bacterium]